MIKIIEEGTIKKTKCKECGCLFSYEKEDINTDGGSNRFDSVRKYIECPQCKHHIIISAAR